MDSDVYPLAYAPQVVDPLLWNYHQMVQQGISQITAIRLSNAGVTWRETERLVNGGCPEELIVQLLVDGELEPQEKVR